MLTRCRSSTRAVLATCVALLLLIGMLPDQALGQRRPPSPPPGPAQSPSAGQRALVPPITEADVEPVADFQDARRVAVSPTTLFYVVDARASTVTAVAPTGRVVVTLGGRGADAGAFDEPLDVDPTNGLEIFVADAGNGRIQHFSRSGKYIESLPVGRVDPGNRTSARQPLFDVGRDGSDARADGRPIAVRAAANGDLFVLDGRERQIVRYGRQRRPEPFAGGFDARDGQLVEPVAMAVDEDRLIVADAGRRQLLFYDRVGSVERAIPVPADVPIRNMAVHGEHLWLVGPVHIVIFDLRRGHPVGRIPVDLEEPIVDATRLKGTLALLTPTRLLLAPRVRLPR